jgi:hypothetical protein
MKILNLYADRQHYTDKTFREKKREYLKNYYLKKKKCVS